MEAPLVQLPLSISRFFTFSCVVIFQRGGMVRLFNSDQSDPQIPAQNGKSLGDSGSVSLSQPGLPQRLFVVIKWGK